MIEQPIVGSSLLKSFETGQGIGFALLEIFMLAALAFYIIFSFVVVKQVGKMTETLEVGFESPLRFIALAHLLASIGLFLLAIIML